MIAQPVQAEPPDTSIKYALTEARRLQQRLQFKALNIGPNRKRPETIGHKNNGRIQEKYQANDTPASVAAVPWHVRAARSRTPEHDRTNLP
jgi:hypothetical protein